MPVVKDALQAEAIDDRRVDRPSRSAARFAAHHDALSPEQRTTTIYPRYLEPSATAPDDEADEAGDVFVFAAEPTFNLLAKNRLSRTQ